MPETAVRDRRRPYTPVEVDSFRPSAARMYDYYLGGANHLAADREAADALIEVVPEVVATARQNRAFLRRTVEYAIREGITQFLDLGSGFATPGGLSEVALAANPAARVVAVDIDPGVATQVGTVARTSRHSGRVGAIHADLRDVLGVLEHQVTQRLIDLDRPVAILCLSVLHFVPGELQRVFRPLRRVAAPGSLLALSHATTSAPTSDDPGAVPDPGRGYGRPAARDREAIVRLVYDCTLTPLELRSEEQLRSALSGLELVEPGLVPVDRWNPSPLDTPADAASLLLGAVARIGG